MTYPTPLATTRYTGPTVDDSPSHTGLVVAAVGGAVLFVLLALWLVVMAIGGGMSSGGHHYAPATPAPHVVVCRVEGNQQVCVGR